MLTVLYGFLLTLLAYLLAKPCNQKIPQIPVLVFGMCFVIGFLMLFGIPYESYMANVNPLFNHLLGYVTVALAIPLAAMRYDDLPLKGIVGILETRNRYFVLSLQIIGINNLYSSWIEYRLLLKTFWQ